MLGVAALSAALLGTGYAAMTDVLTIGGTVNTANFDVDFEGETMLPVEGAATNQEANEIKGITTTVDSANDTASIQIDNLKPGVAVTHSTIMKNTGTINAELKSITLVADKDNAERLNANTKITVVLNNDDNQKFEGTLAEFKNKGVNNIILEDGGASVPVNVTVQMEGKAFGVPGKEDADTTQATIKFDIKFNWEQTENQPTFPALL